MTQAIVPRSPEVLEIVRLVLDGLGSPKSRAVYSTALYRFLDWREKAGNPAFSKRMVQRYRAELLESDLAPASINLHLCAIRKMALEAGDGGYLDPNVAAAIGRVPNVSHSGRKVGRWLSKEEAVALLSQPDTSTLIGLRDRALLGVLIGAALRRAEAVSLVVGHFQQREERWIIADLVGKGNRTRSIPIPFWVKAVVDEWLEAAKIVEGYIFVRVRRGGHPMKDALSDRAIYDIVSKYIVKIAPHDLRRTWARLAHRGGAPLDQISLSLGHANLTTTEKYLGLAQNLELGKAACDFLNLEEDE